MPRTADIVVAGAGHNSLVTAAYLAKAGYRVQVLDARPVPGGGAVTEEPLLPGYRIDTCSTGHTLIRANPLIAADEVGLMSRHGLRYVDPDPVAHVVFPDGASITMHLDIDRTVAEIARHSRADAESYRRLLSEWAEVSPLFLKRRFEPPGGPSIFDDLQTHPKGRIWQRRLMMSAADVIFLEFEEPHVRSFMLWVAAQTNVDLSQAGTGDLAYSIIAGRQKNSWSIPLGGSGRLIDALLDVLCSHGGEIDCNQTVARLILEDGRCTGVETTEGTRYFGERAVVSTIHAKHLIDMAPEACWPEEFRFGIRSYDVGMAAHGTYLLTKAAPVFRGVEGALSVVSAGYAAWPEDFLRRQFDIRRGRWLDDPAWLLIACPSLVDPDRTPHKGHQTVKILGPQAYAPPAGADPDRAAQDYADRCLALLRDHADNLDEGSILARMVKAPKDYEAANPHMIRGAFHGGDRGLAQSGLNRPAPGWGGYRMPIPGLYQTGGCTHPGGSITGVPGRNCAQVLLRDLGHDIATLADGSAVRAGSPAAG